MISVDIMQFMCYISTILATILLKVKHLPNPIYHKRNCIFEKKIKFLNLVVNSTWTDDFVNKIMTTDYNSIVLW